jgi:hypothetical protein
VIKFRAIGAHRVIRQNIVKKNKLLIFPDSPPGYMSYICLT